VRVCEKGYFGEGLDQTAGTDRMLEEIVWSEYSQFFLSSNIRSLEMENKTREA
jgi:hypothetical protein